MKPKLFTWDELDKMGSAEEIANALLQAGITGHRRIPAWCPLAKATGCIVSLISRLHIDGEREPLTLPQQQFVRRFDLGHYPQLEAHTK